MFSLNPQPHLLIFLLVLVLFPHSSVQSLRFEVQSGGARCISEDMRPNSMTVGNYSIANPNEGHPLPESHKLIVRLVSPGGELGHFGDHVQSGQFAFEAMETGNYIICFWGADHNPKVTFSVDFEWRSGVPTKDWNVAKKTNIDAMTSSVMDLQNTVSSIHEEMFYLRLRQDENQEFNWATNTRMFWLSLLSLFVCFSVAGLQLWHLKTFFEKKKII